MIESEHITFLKTFCLPKIFKKALINQKKVLYSFTALAKT